MTSVPLVCDTVNSRNRHADDKQRPPSFRKVTLSKCGTPDFESRDAQKRSLDSAEAPLQQHLSAKLVDHAAKHVDRNDFPDALGTKMLDEVNMFFVKGDVKLQFTTWALDSQFSDVMRA